MARLEPSKSSTFARQVSVNADSSKKSTRKNAVRAFVCGLISWCALTGATSEAGTYQLRPEVPGVFKNPSGGTIEFTNGSNAYYRINGTTEYGASKGQDYSFVKCSGVITSIYDWVPNRIPNPDPAALADSDPTNDTIPDPLDPPPTEVISMERSYARYYTENPGGIGTAFNGLSFLPIVFGNGEVSTGTLYKKRPGGASITLTCDPYVEVVTSPTSGRAFGSVSYVSSIIVPTIIQSGATRFYNPDSVKFITGQRIHNRINSTSPLTIQKYQWSVTNAATGPFKDYKDQLGQKIELLPADYKLLDLAFYTVDKGKTKVACDLEFNLPAESRFEGGLPAFRAESVEMESVRPEFVGWDVNDGSVTLNTNNFIFGTDANSSNGQEWLNVEYQLPTEFGQVGQGCFLQLINADRHLYRTVAGTGPKHFVKDPHNALEAVDMGFPYPYGATWNISTKGTGVDSPLQPLSWTYPNTISWYESTAKDSFTTWAMYKPPANGQTTVWIPIAKYTWAWQGKARLEPSGWVLSGTSGGLTSSPVVTIQHPTWTRQSPSPFGFIAVP